MSCWTETDHCIQNDAVMLYRFDMIIDLSRKGMLVMSFKDIPETTALSYISGLQSLNLDLRDGTGVGWHFANLWLSGKKPLKLYGKGTPVDTTNIFGYIGIADRSVSLQRLGAKVRKVYVANHIRAALDSVYESLIKYKHVGPIRGEVDHFFPDDEDKEKMFKYLLILFHHLDRDRREILDDWLSEEFRTLYKRWKSDRLQSKEVVFDLEDA